MGHHDASELGDPVRPRHLICEACGKPFECSLDGTCWCAAEAVRLPLPASGDCLCPDCLRKRVVA